MTIIGRARPKNDKVIVDCGESASTLRFLIPLFSQFSEATFIGKKSLLSRPLDVYQEIYANQLLDFNLYPNYLTIKGQIKPGKYIINDPKSSQFISGLLFYLPLLEDDSIIEINNLVSKPYLDLTLEFLKQAKINIIKEDNKLIIPGNQRYQPFNVDIEGDLSQIGYFLTLGAFGGPITINNINFQSLQGDKQIIDLFTKINAQIEFKENSLTIYKSNLTNFTYDLNHTPDLGLLLFAICACIDQKSTITNVSRLQFKESNRLAVGLKIITALGGKYKFLDNGNTIVIIGSSNLKQIKEFDSHHDHRVVFTLASISPILASPLTITNANVVTKSYPHFWHDFEQLGGIIQR